MLFILLLFVNLAQADQSVAQNQNATSSDLTALERGLEAEQAGDIEGALDIWLNAKATVEHPSTAIGSNYVRLVTEQEMTDYYTVASAMYLWGLTAEEVAPNREGLEQEIAFISPLLSEDRQKEWRTLLEENDPKIYREMEQWWKRVDPTPQSPYNERLVEHWERIAYAREHFRSGDSSVYGTDDRGVTWVRYGEPERKFAKTFNISGGDAYSVTDQLLTLWKLGEPDARHTFARAMENAVNELFLPPPRYEVWIYDAEYLGTEESLLKIFGEVQGGPIQHVRTLDELIPNSAYTLTSRFAYQGAGGKIDFPINPAMILQELIYRETASMDPTLGRNYSQLNSRLFSYNGGNPPGKQYTQVVKQEHIHEEEQRLNEAPPETSTIAKDVGMIPLDIFQYRMLDEQNRPVFATFIESQPQQRFLEDLAMNQDAMMEGLDDEAQVQTINDSYQLFHGVQLRSESGEILTGTRLQSTLVIDGDDMQVTSGSAFTIPFVSQNTEQHFFAELHNRHQNSAPRFETPFPDYLRGLGRESNAQPEPLNPDPSQLAMSDLILGYDLKENASGNSFLPFVVSNDREIPEGETLAVHFEIYHLESDADGIRRFSIDYEIRPVNFLGWTQERQDQLSLTLNFEHDLSRFEENLEVEAANLEPGRYVLRLNTTDSNSGQEVRREIEFTVVEAEEEVEEEE